MEVEHKPALIETMVKCSCGMMVPARLLHEIVEGRAQDPDPDLDRDELTRRAARWHYQKSGEHSPDGPARWLSSEVADFAIEFAREVAANDAMPDDWKRRCYLLSWELRNVHNPSVCDETNADEDCDTCAYLCEILGELGDWTPEENAERAIPPPYSGKGGKDD